MYGGHCLLNGFGSFQSFLQPEGHKNVAAVIWYSCKFFNENLFCIVFLFRTRFPFLNSDNPQQY